MTDVAVSEVAELLDALRQGRMVVLIDDQHELRSQGVVLVAAEHCRDEHITLMARRARGLVCLALTRERCEELDLPPMVDRGDGDSARFTLSIEAAQGSDTGSSAADRAHTVRVAVAADPPRGWRGQIQRRSTAARRREKEARTMATPSPLMA